MGHLLTNPTRRNFFFSALASLGITLISALSIQTLIPHYQATRVLNYYLPDDNSVLLAQDLNHDRIPEWINIFQPDSGLITVQFRQTDQKLIKSYIIRGSLLETNDWRFEDFNHDNSKEVIFLTRRDDSLFATVCSLTDVKEINLSEYFRESLSLPSAREPSQDVRIWTSVNDGLTQLFISATNRQKFFPLKIFSLSFNESWDFPRFNPTNHKDFRNTVKTYSVSGDEHFQYPVVLTKEELENTLSYPLNPDNHRLAYHLWKYHDTLRLVLWMNSSNPETSHSEMLLFILSNGGWSYKAKRKFFTNVFPLHNRALTDIIQYYDSKGTLYNLSVDLNGEPKFAFPYNKWILPHKAEIESFQGDPYMIFKGREENSISFLNLATGEFYTISENIPPEIYASPCYFQSDTEKGVFLGRKGHVVSGFEFKKSPFHRAKWVIYGLTFTLLTVLIFFFLQHITLRIRSLKLEQKVADQKLQTLQNRPDLHFVFNVFNAISLKILQMDKEGAYEIFQKLMKFLRMVFEEKKNGLRTLQEELDHTRFYLDLEKARFRERFDYSINIEPDVDLSGLIPSMILQKCAHLLLNYSLLVNESVGLLKITVGQNNNKLKIIAAGEFRDMTQSLKSSTKNLDHFLKEIKEMEESFNSGKKEKLLVDLNQFFTNNNTDERQIVIYFCS